MLLPACLRRSSPEKKLQETLYYGIGASEKSTPVGAGAFDFSSEKQFSLANEIHSVTYSPELDLRVYLPKQGKLGYLQRGKTGELVPVAPAPGKLFYGHGAFDLERGFFYSTQSTVSSEYQRDQLFDKGEIHAHDLKTFRITKSLPSYGYNPHDLKLDRGRLIVCNGGDKSNVAFIDPTSEKLLKSFDLPGSPHISFGHLELLEDGSLLVASGSRRKSLPCELFGVTLESGLRPFSIPNGLETFFIGQLLSVIHHGDYAYATCPATGHVFAWRLDGRFLSALSFKNASSLAYSPSRKQIIAGSGNFEEQLQVIVENGDHVSLTGIPGPKIRTGSHANLILEG